MRTREPATISALPPCASAIARTIARPRPAPPRVRASSPRAKRSNARSAMAAGKPSALVGDLDRRAAVHCARAQQDVAGAVTQRIVDEVAHGLAYAQRVGEHRRARRDVELDLAPLRGRTLREARAGAGEQLRHVERLRSHLEAALRAAREQQQVVGQPRQVVGLVDRREQRLAHLGRMLAPEQRLQLGLQDGDRRAQLVAGVGDEAPLALERARAGGRASRSASRRGGGSRRARRGAEGRSSAVSDTPSRAAPHRLDGAQRRGRERRSPAARRAATAIGPPIANEASEPGERLVAVVERLADHHHAAAARGTCQQARRPLDAADRPLDHQGSRCASRSARRQHGAEDRAGAAGAGAPA